MGRGDQKERFLQAFDTHGDALFRHAAFRISDRERAVDLVHDAYLKTWDYVVKGNEVEDFKSFLYRTLNNLIIDEYRRRSSESLDALLESEGVTEGSFDALVIDGKEIIEIASDAQEVAGLLARMPMQYRIVVVMRFMDGLHPKEIAEVLGESVNAISVRIHRGIQWLKKQAEAQI
jgi:RNA polymerase sigma-70 factor (ECF subfamily)